MSPGLSHPASSVPACTMSSDGIHRVVYPGVYRVVYTQVVYTFLYPGGIYQEVHLSHTRVYHRRYTSHTRVYHRVYLSHLLYLRVYLSHLLYLRVDTFLHKR